MIRSTSSSRGLIYFALAALLVIAVTASGLLLATCNKDDKAALPNSGFSSGKFIPVTVSPAVQKASNTALIASVASKGRARLIVQVATGLSPNASAQDTVRAIAGAQDNVLASLSGSVNVVSRLQRLPLMVVEVDEAGARSLAGSTGVVSMMEDTIDRIALSDSVPLIGGPAAFAAGATGRGWSVAVLDSGVEASHSFLSGKVVAEACFSTTDTAEGSRSVCPNGSSSQEGKGAAAPCPHAVDGCDHGTHVAGIAAGNGSGGTGVAKDATIVAVQIFSSFSSDCATGSSSCARTFTSDQIRGLEWVLQNHDQYHIAAVNMSLGGGKYTTQDACDSANGPRKAAIDSLVAAGVAVVISSGNESYTDGIGAPGCISSAIAVGATSKTDKIAPFSNSSDMLDILAPGVSIRSSIPGNGWAAWDGTSMASPHVAGAFTALRSIKPDATVAELFEALWKNGKSISDPRNGITRNRIQVDKAALALKGGSGPRPTPQPKPTQPPAPRPNPNRGVPNDDVNNPTAITGTYFKDTLDARLATLFDDPVIQPGPYCEEGGQFDHTVWYSFTAPANGYVQFTTEGSNYDTIMAVFQGSRGAPDQAACVDDDGWPKVLTSTMGGWVRAGTTFRVEIAAWDDGGDLIFQAAFKADNSAAQFTDEKLSPFALDQDLSQAPSDNAVSRGGRISRTTAPCRYKEHRPGIAQGTCFTQ